MPNERLLFWDSNVFISRIEKTPGRITVLEQLTGAAEAGQLRLVTSALTLAEVAVIRDAGLPDDQERLIVDFFENDYIVVRSVDRFVAEKAREIIRSHGIKGADAVQVAVALQSKAHEFHTYDTTLLKKLGPNTLPGLPVVEPHWDTQWSLPLEPPPSGPSGS